MQSKITVDLFGKKSSKGTVGDFQSEVTDIQIINNQLNISGTNLDDIEELKITGPGGFEEVFVIESKDESSLIANPSRNFEFIADQVFSLLISNAYGQSSFSITVSSALTYFFDCNFFRASHLGSVSSAFCEAFFPSFDEF